MKLLFLILFTSITFGQSNLLLLMDDTGYDADAKLYFDAMTTPLSADTKTKINTFVKMLKDSLQITALSQKFDVMYLLANQTSEAGLKNLVKRSHDATAVNSPTFTQWEGFQGNGVSSYLNTNYDIATNSITYTQNNASAGIYVRTLGTISTTIPLFGSVFSSSALRMVTGSRVYINDGSYVSPVGINNGINIISRISSIEKVFTNNTASTTISVNSVAGYSGTVLILSNSGSSSYSDAQASFFFVGSGLTNSESRKIANCIEWYMDSLGKGVIP